MIVYLVSVGEYSDYSVEGIFSSRDKATEHMGGKPERFNEIEEFELDSRIPIKWTTQWRVYLTKSGSLYEPLPHSVYNNPNGASIRGEMLTPRELEGRAVLGFNPAYVKKIEPEYGWFVATSYTSFAHALDLAHALRIATEQQHPDWFN